MVRNLKTSRIAVLITSHNRREMTLACLNSLFAQKLPQRTSFSVYLVDDGSTDKTGTAVHERYPLVAVIKGNGHLYWCGGMRLAWQKALEHEYDYYLWLNDDTLLYPRAIYTLLRALRTVSQHNGGSSIIVGSVCDPHSGLMTYGGVRMEKNVGMVAFKPVVPLSDRPLACSTFNGNVVLIPHDVARSVGNISSAFTHGIGDYDYGLRALEMGFACSVAPGFVGTCKKHTIGGSFRDPGVPMKERMRKMVSPTGLPPAREWMVFTRRHAGRLWPLYWLRVLVRTAFPRLWLCLRAERTYR